MAIHEHESPLAGKTVKLVDGREYRVEDWADRVIGGQSWAKMHGHPACIQYAARAGMSGPLCNDEVLYGKIGCYGELIHMTEIAGNEDGHTDN